MRFEFVGDLLCRPVQVDHAMRGYVDTGAVHIYFARRVYRLHFWIVYDCSKLVHLLECGNLEDACFDDAPVHAELFAESFFLLLRIGAQGNDRFEAFVVQRFNLFHLWIHAAPQCWCYLLHWGVDKGCIQKCKLQSQIMNVQSFHLAKDCQLDEAGVQKVAGTQICVEGCEERLLDGFSATCDGS